MHQSYAPPPAHRLQRRLHASGHLSWLSPTASPDLGGHPAIATDGGGAQEIDSPEVSVPGMYRVVCVDLQLDNLAASEVSLIKMMEGHIWPWLAG